MKVFAAAATAFAAACLFSGAAHAADQRIAYGDLDLSSPEGVAALDSRIDIAARDLCRERERRDNACRLAVRQEALEKIALNQEARRAAPVQLADMGQRAAQ